MAIASRFIKIEDRASLNGGGRVLKGIRVVIQGERNPANALESTRG